ncbi:hypothetical protein [Flammeovirga sp. SJP92]|uniref:hypothetical protein n=1 Tax=Flammeovirga sp. SJP92 TaxID=1775430 RepID=UPI0007885058|nr:hypothetical protein [Flammeovirga sp. SJP92]KXX66881.1 hypothetical protein AVL50_30595 [Flammeovirga sp. SJP92]
MKIYLISIIILSFCACVNPKNKESKQTINQPVGQVDTLHKTEIVKKEITFSKANGEAVLIGEVIELLDYDLKVIADISNLNGAIVNIKSVSDSLYNQGKDFEGFCKSFWYVEIEIDSIKGIVNGRQVFKIQDLTATEKFTVNGTCIEFLRTDFFGMGVVYQGELMGCSVDQPIIIKDTTNNYYGLVELVENDYSKKASWGSVYSYLELKNDDGGYDTIDTLIVEDSKIKLKIHRGFQEGENESDVVLNFKDGKYQAEYLNFGEVKYE